MIMIECDEYYVKDRYRLIEAGEPWRGCVINQLHEPSSHLIMGVILIMIINIMIIVNYQIITTMIINIRSSSPCSLISSSLSWWSSSWASLMDWTCLSCSPASSEGLALNIDSASCTLQFYLREYFEYLPCNFYLRIGINMNIEYWILKV